MNPQAPIPAAAQGYTSASLYVGDLHPDILESHLFELFKQIGPVASIRVCRDAVTRRSLGYAYVNFFQLPDAERALDLLNYRELKGKQIRIMWSQRDPNLRRSNQGNIFIKNLDKAIDNKALYDTFATFGNILSCKVATDENGNSLGYGFVHYETQEAADKAVAKVNGKLLNGKKCFVGLFVPKKERKDAGADKWTNVFVKNVPKSMTEEQFAAMLAEFGKVTSYVLRFKEGDATDTKGFGFANYENHEDAVKAVEALNGKEIGGSELFVGKAQKKAEREKELRAMFDKLKRERISKYQGVNLYVKNLDETVDDARLRKEFEACGTITSCAIMRDDKKASKGFGFVCFATPDEATKAVSEMNGKMIESKPIYVALAERKEQRRAKLEAQFAQRVNAAGMSGGVRMVPPGAAIPPNMYPGAPMGYFPPAARGGPPGSFVGFPPNAAGVPQQGGRGAGRQAGFGGQPGVGRQQGGQPGLPQQGGQFPQGQVPFGQGGQRVPRVQGRGGPQLGGRGQPGAAPAAGAAQAGQPGYPVKYTGNVRNPQAPQVPSLAELEQLAPVQRKQILGEALYPLIANSLKSLGNQEELSGKITGMLLESSDTAELLNLLENPKVLDKKIQDGLDVLENAKQADGEAQ